MKAPLVTLVCDYCGADVIRRISDIAHRRRNGQTTFYCGKKCSTRVNARKDSIKRYRRTVTPDGRAMYEHRYIMEIELGRPLLREEQVHHKNEDIRDNRPENLMLVTAKEHALEHSDRGRKYDLNFAIDLYRAGKTFEEIAEAVGAYAAADVWKSLVAHGIHEIGKKRHTRKAHWKFDLDEFKRLAAEGRTCQEISSALGISMDRTYDIRRIYRIETVHGKRHGHV